MLDSIKYAFDIIPATEDSAFLNKFLGLKIHPLLVGAGGFISASISTYQNIKELWYAIGYFTLVNNWNYQKRLSALTIQSGGGMNFL